MNQFLNDVLKGLSSPKKYLESKYFYDETGDVLFQKIMACNDYYLTRCEMEIFTEQTASLASCLTHSNEPFDVVELGAGDATKSIHLLQHLINDQVDFTYYPVDISASVISLLTDQLPQQLPTLKMQGLNGEYIEMLEKSKHLSSKKKVVLFLGSNIGNVSLEQSSVFCKQLRQHLSVGDKLMVGFDLQKDPQVILNAYNDSDGFTRRFNLNLLHRINKELSGNFNVNEFKHYANYDPGSGACKSYLISQADQQVEVADRSFYFNQYEPVYMEVSQKYTLTQIRELAANCGFKPVAEFMDSKKWFVDTVWECV